MLAHRLRTRLLRVLSERVASPAELSRELDQPLNTVADRVRALWPGRGASSSCAGAGGRPSTSTGRRPCRCSDDDLWGELPPEVTRNMHGAALQDVFTPVLAAARTDGFDHPPTRVSCTPCASTTRG